MIRSILNVAWLQRRCAVMFAPLISKAKASADPFKTSAAQRSPLVKHQLSGVAEDALILQRTVGTQAPLRLFAHQPRSHEQRSGPAGPTPTLGESWDFSKIPLFPPDRTQASRPVKIGR